MIMQMTRFSLLIALIGVSGGSLYAGNASFRVYVYSTGAWGHSEKRQKNIDLSQEKADSFVTFFREFNQVFNSSITWAFDSQRAACDVADFTHWFYADGEGKADNISSYYNQRFEDELVGKRLYQEFARMSLNEHAKFTDLGKKCLQAVRQSFQEGVQNYILSGSLDHPAAHLFVLDELPGNPEWLGLIEGKAQELAADALDEEFYKTMVEQVPEKDSGYEQRLSKLLEVRCHDRRARGKAELESEKSVYRSVNEPFDPKAFAQHLGDIYVRDYWRLLEHASRHGNVHALRFLATPDSFNKYASCQSLYEGLPESDRPQESDENMQLPDFGLYCLQSIGRTFALAEKNVDQFVELMREIVKHYSITIKEPRTVPLLCSGHYRDESLASRMAPLLCRNDLDENLKRRVFKALSSSEARTPHDRSRGGSAGSQERAEAVGSSDDGSTHNSDATPSIVKAWKRIAMYTLGLGVLGALSYRLLSEAPPADISLAQE